MPCLRLVAAAVLSVLQSVLRRLRAYQCLDALQSTVGPMLAGKVNALLLSPPEFCAHINQVAAAASDLSTLVLQPPQSRRSGGAAQASGGAPLQLQRQEADACVLQLMLAFRVLDLLAAFVVYISVHVCRLVQLQKQLLAGGGAGGRAGFKSLAWMVVPWAAHPCRQTCCALRLHCYRCHTEPHTLSVRLHHSVFCLCACCRPAYC